VKAKAHMTFGQATLKKQKQYQIFYNFFLILKSNRITIMYDITMTSLEISESSQPGESVGGVQATDPDSTVVWLYINYPYQSVTLTTKAFL
jgi:hypothetical protein